jgi:hypothetical protein
MKLLESNLQGFEKYLQRFRKRKKRFVLISGTSIISEDEHFVNYVSGFQPKVRTAELQIRGLMDHQNISFAYF